MKLNNLRAFEKHLGDASKNHLSELYLIIAKEDHSRKEAEKTLLKALFDDESGLKDALKTFDAETSTIKQILTELSSLSFFSEKKVVVVRKAEALNKDSQTALQNAFNTLPPQTTLILTASTLNRATKLYKNGEKIGIILDLEEEKPWEKEKSLVEKVRSIALKARKQMSQQTAQYLIKFIGKDLAILEQEMFKLLCFTVDEHEITTDAINKICTGTHSQTIWELGDAIFDLNAARALKIAKSFQQENTPLFSLTRLLRTQFQTKLQICTILVEGKGTNEITQKFPYLRGHILQNTINCANNYGLKRFISGIIAIDKTELLAKNSSIDHTLLLDKLIIQLVGA